MKRYIIIRHGQDIEFMSYNTVDEAEDFVKRTAQDEYDYSTVVKDITEVEVILFKDSGKYYTTETWKLPDKEGYIGPYDMKFSADFHRIGNGKVLIPSQEPWGYPHLI